jgi:hypothetical protein
MRAPSVKPQYGPTLPELLVPRWRSAANRQRGLAGGGLLVLVVAAAAVAITYPRLSSFVYRGRPPTFNLTYPARLGSVTPPAGADLRLESRSRSGRLLAWFEVDRVKLPPYSGEVSGQLPVFATNYIAGLARTVPDFVLQTEAKTRINLVAGYSVTYRGRFNGQLMYVRTVLLVPALTGVRDGVSLNMGIVPNKSLDPSPDFVGVADVLQKPFRSFRFGT